MASFNYEEWNEKYHNKKFIDLSMYFSPEQKELLKKFDIILEEKLYTEFEFDVIDEKLILFYKDEEEMDEEELKECEELGNKLGSFVPKGAGVMVDDYGKKIVNKFGKDILREVAKLNFKNTEKILNN